MRVFEGPPPADFDHRALRGDAGTRGNGVVGLEPRDAHEGCVDHPRDLFCHDGEEVGRLHTIRDERRDASERRLLAPPRLAHLGHAVLRMDEHDRRAARAAPRQPSRGAARRQRPQRTVRQYATVIASSTDVTPGAAQAASSASSCSAHDLTLPLMVTVPLWVETHSWFASSAAFRSNALLIDC